MLRTISLALLVTVLATPAGGQVLEGTATAVDGDTLDMTGMRIRLLHIDAPEAGQTCSVEGVSRACGTEATATLAALVEGEAVTCVSASRDIYGRYLATCRTRVLDPGEQMAAQGLAVVTAEAPDSYLAAVGRAKSLRLGLWASSFENPADWRARHEQPAPQALVAREQPPVPARSDRSDHGCAIKGNRSRRGERIYHVPGQQYYERTRAEELFCSEAEARAAGYRRSKV